MVLASVIIPVFNGEKTISETLESVLNQTCKNLEVIVVDDGSTDGTVNIVKRFKDPRIRIKSFPNKGLAASRNRGARRAKGDFISFVDADDVWTPEKLSEQIAALENDLEAAVVYSWNDFVDESSEFIRHGIHLTYHGNIYPKLLARNFIENGSNILVRRRVFDEVGYFDESLTHIEDWDFYFRLAAAYKFVCAPKVHVLYRVSQNSMSTQVLKMEKASVQVLRRAFENAPKDYYHLWNESFADAYSYLFYRSFKKPHTRENCKTMLLLLFRGIRCSPLLFRCIPKRRIFLVMLHLIRPVSPEG